MRRLYAKTAKDVTKSRNRVNEHRKQENENGLTKQGIGNEVTDRPRVPGFVPCFIFPFPYFRFSF